MVKDLKDTLNLPKTDFPMRANLVSREPERIAHWEKTRLYDRIQAGNAKGDTYVLHDGPPFTNGDLHMGHALNKYLKEIILRYKSMRGFRTPYIPGWDCHGLPIEHKVASRLREEGKTLSIPELRDACAAFSQSFIEKQRSQFKRLGVIADWEREYKTMDPAYEAEILRTFAAFVEKGLVYRDKKPVYWSIPCETALAEAEIEYRDHTSPSIWVKFPIRNPDHLGVSAPASVVIWTTTPWTLPANLAVAVHPELEYAFLSDGTESCLVAADLAERFAEECGRKIRETVKTARGRELEGVETSHPFIERTSRIVLADYVTTETGTGCVHIAPGHGLEDYHTGLAYDLPVYCPIDDQGCYTAGEEMPEELTGVSVLETNGQCPANDAVLKLLKANGRLVHLTKLSHSYPHCWRSKTPLIFRAMDQWFVALDKDGVRSAALDAIGKVQWIPAWGESRIRGTVESRPDWCISRQRAWGVPIPVFFDADRNPCMDPGVIRALADKIESHGTQYWFQEETASLLDGIPLPESWQEKDLSKGTDTLDVWIDSGVSHLAVLKKNPLLQWPADLYLEGSDQHRGWFQSSLLSSVIVTREAPYRQVLTHGFIVGQDGRKLSKSEGEAQTAEDFVGKFGADILRLWVASTDFRGDVPLSEEILSHVADSYRTFRNTMRFQISNLFDFDRDTHEVAVEEMDAIDRWALHQAAVLADEAQSAYELFEFHRVFQLCNQFCTVTLSAVYHDILKDRLYTLAAGSPSRRSSQTAIHHILTVLAKVLAPILPFTTDEAWGYFTEKTDLADNSIHTESWPAIPSSWRNENLVEEVDRLLSLRDRVNEKLEACRKAKEIGKSLEAAVTLRCPTGHPDAALLRRYQAFLPELFIVSKVELQFDEFNEVDIIAGHSGGNRCPRCWRWVDSFVPVSQEIEVCDRCADAL